jgi:tRNA threonylcarbamoyladenosine biosynthesis protein TsaE
MSNLATAIALPNQAATHQLGKTLGQLLPEGSLLLLYGDLGSGKTTLVQGIGEGLGLIEPVISPTFVLINEYIEGRVPLYHLDLYRLSPAEVEALHIDSYWEGLEFPLGIVAIEWAERLEHPPSTYLQVELTPTETGRSLKLTPVGDWPEALLKQVVDAISAC